MRKVNWLKILFILDLFLLKIFRIEKWPNFSSSMQFYKNQSYQQFSCKISMITPQNFEFYINFFTCLFTFFQVPPMFAPPPVPPFFFAPPQVPPFVPAPASSSATSAPIPSTSIEINTAVPPPVKPTVHYPSQDPSRLGSTQILADHQE